MLLKFHRFFTVSPDRPSGGASEQARIDAVIRHFTTTLLPWVNFDHTGSIILGNRPVPPDGGDKNVSVNWVLRRKEDKKIITFFRDIFNLKL